jgi:hypothetical protein
VSDLFNAALEIANERRKLFDELTEAVQADDRRAAWEISKRLCGISEDAPKLN